MTNQHPITPPPELLQQWATEYWGNPGESIGCGEKHIAIRAARWGADQELQACINFVYDNELCDPDFYNNLRAARRPKPPSLKEQALDALEQLLRDPEAGCFAAAPDTIRRALEALPND
jgi:hypothetical protein